eukprot:4152995-Prymnesium_polylepis.2
MKPKPPIAAMAAQPLRASNEKASSAHSKSVGGIDMWAQRRPLRGLRSAVRGGAPPAEPEERYWCRGASNQKNYLHSHTFVINLGGRRSQ